MASQSTPSPSKRPPTLVHPFSCTDRSRYDDPESPYSVGCVLEFDSMDSFKKAGASPEAAEIFGDIPNFSNEKPSIIAGEVTGTS